VVICVRGIVNISLKLTLQKPLESVVDEKTPQHMTPFGSYHGTRASPCLLQSVPVYCISYSLMSCFLWQIQGWKSWTDCGGSIIRSLLGLTLSIKDGARAAEHFSPS